MVQDSATFFQVLIDLLLWLLIFLSFKKSFNYPFHIPVNSKRIGIFLILLFCLFAFWGGDYFHYRSAFNEFKLTGDINQESVYKWFYSTFSFSYTAFRLAIWGLALTALLWAYSRLTPSVDLTLFFFGTSFLPIFSYARASLAMSIIILGISFISHPIKRFRLISLLIGTALLGVSVYFHKSAPIGVAMAFSSLFMIKANKTKLLLVAFMAPLFVFVLQQAFGFFTIMDLDSETFITEHYRNRIVDAESRHVRSIGPFVNSVVTQFPVYFAAFLYVVIVWSGDLKQFTVGEKAISAYAFCITLLAILFSFDMGIDTRVLQYRTLFYSMPAYAVFLAAVRRYNLKPKLARLVFYFACFSGFYQVLYATYCAAV